MDAVDIKINITVKAKASVYGHEEGVNEIVVDSLTIKGDGPIPAEVGTLEFDKRVKAALVKYISVKG